MNSVFAIFGIFGEWIEGVYLMVRDTVYEIAEMRRQYKKYSRKEGIEYYSYLFGHTIFILFKTIFYILALTITCAAFLLFLTLVIMLKVAVYSVIVICGLLFLFAGLS
jgi:hypothetical protein